MTPNFAGARQHIENARSILSVEDPKAQRMCEVLDLAIEALVIAESQVSRKGAIVIKGSFQKSSS
jgi:hypothetical protein